ncbi:hypothetical protein WICANDRAFT_31099 [Wickerhamomyces anomalus NRRL Y-366-8]|uniref:ferric-chelate reductase (NADPH) n=1 Tax=Wickerhamomyces anomalus (strain ATCC 58044 / CBS 1984 / NCYC 433 / NRRL Y-366-8) TaxID=683960 RepID=A0A1E3P475_WICAA|nr:uncharacterized protein WICANDRAFT_31099 [Wickerhamomyces anomalus NRRL Y-366-8]ODQ60289.1 hypothetical protein WICANDRAFT_31099 [Wickerhamomyces anomalus NRRL Y-366-8]
MKLTSILSWLHLFIIVSAVEKFRYSHDELVVIGCKYALTHTALFCEDDNDQSYSCQCLDPAAKASLMNCIYEKTSINNTKAEYILIQYCENLNVTLDSADLRQAYKNGTKYMVKTTDISGFNISSVIKSPIDHYNSTAYDSAYGTYWAFYGMIADSIYFGGGIMGYWAVIFLGAALANLTSKMAFASGHFNYSLVNKIRKNITMPAMFSNKKHTQAVYPFGRRLSMLSGLLPTRGESIVIFGFFLLNVIFEGARYHFVQRNTFFPNQTSQMSVYIGIRAGILALYGFQLTYLFAGRNNFLIWLTGWKQSTFITYHKWISRFNFLLIVVHAASLHIQSKASGRFEQRIATHWYKWGIVAGIVGGIIMVSAIHWTRTHYYELFLLIHIAMAVLFLTASWIHIHNFKYSEFAYSMAAIWAFDRAVRIGRLFSFGVRTATVTVVSDETLKIRIPKPKYWNAFPGSFGYIHFLRPTTFFQSHPFTLVSDNENEVCVYAKIKGGVTSQVHKDLASQSNKTGKIKVTVEGPYGDPKPMKHYDTCLLYAGGNGIPGIYAYAKKLAQISNKHIKLYWVIRNWHSIDWFYEELLTLKSLPLDVIIYITKADSSLGSKFGSISSESYFNEKEDASINDMSQRNSNKKLPQDSTPHEIVSRYLDFVEFRFGRPNIDQLIREDLEEAEENSVGVMTCAHNAMVDGIRDAVSQNLDATKGRVDYFEELQTW